VYEIHNIRQKICCEFCEELCQVGIEHMHRGALGRTWLWVQKGELESLRILKSSAKWGLSRCKECIEDKTVGRSRRRYSARWAFELVCRQAQDEENSLSSILWRRNPLRDLRRVTEHPAGSTRGCLGEDSQEGIHISPSEGERRNELSFLGGRSYKKAQEEQHHGERKWGLKPRACRGREDKGWGLWELEILPSLGR